MEQKNAGAWDKRTTPSSDWRIKWASAERMEFLSRFYRKCYFSPGSSKAWGLPASEQACCGYEGTLDSLSLAETWPSHPLLGSGSSPFLEFPRFNHFPTDGDSYVLWLPRKEPHSQITLCSASSSLTWRKGPHICKPSVESFLARARHWPRHHSHSSEDRR